MKKILFVIEDLGGGGAERVLINLVNFMDKTVYDITVLTLFDGGVNADTLSKDVRFVNLNKKKFKGIKTVYKFLPKKILYKYYLSRFVKRERFDLLVAYMTGVPTFVVSGAKCKKIAWVHGEFFKSFNSFGLKHIYDKFDKIACVSRHVSDTVENVISPDKKPETVYNTNDFGRIIRLSKEDSDLRFDKSKLNVATVGCLESSKGYDRLIDVCRKLKDSGMNFNLNIIGKGILLDSLQNQIKELKLEDTVILSGYQKNPYKFVAGADIFVCSSRTEGLSTAVTEAVILGIPVVSTDVSGAREILGENSEYGMVVENSEQGLYNGIKKMLEDSGLRAHYREKAKERAPFFDTANTVAQAQKLFEDLLSQK